MTRLKLPRFPYSAREPVSGACFTVHTDELSKTLLAEQLSVHLAGLLVDLARRTWQTDNGCEFRENPPRLRHVSAADIVFGFGHARAGRALQRGSKHESIRRPSPKNH
jgi:hypothetical protein